MVHVEALIGVMCLLNCIMFCMYSISHINLIDVGLQKKRLFQDQKLTILSLEKQNISKKTLIRLLGAA